MNRATISLAIAAGTLATSLGYVHASSHQQPPASTPTVTTPALTTQGAAASAERALLDRYCVSCHNPRTKAGDLLLDREDVDQVQGNPHVWEKVVRKLRAGMMPPPGSRRPGQPAIDAFVTYLETGLDRAADAKPNPGRPESFRRLNRTEYQNAIRDLLALDVDATSLLPRDDSSFGFDNINVSGLSPTLIERYMSAAKDISRRAVGTPMRAPESSTITIPDDRGQDDRLEGLPFGTRGGAVVRHNFPRDGIYVIRVRLGRERNGGIAGLASLIGTDHLEVTIDGEVVERFTIEPPQSGRRLTNSQALANNSEEQVDAQFNVEIVAKAGPREIGVAFVKKSSALIETERQPWMRRHAADYADQRTQPVVQTINISGPMEDQGPGDTPSRRRIFTCRPGSARTSDHECATTILSTLARRAYRRPVDQEDLKPLLQFYREGRHDGDFESGIEAAVRALLVSPQFLFRIEQDRQPATAGRPYRLNDIELASRLSFFLWSSIPDDELLEAAARKKLSQPAVLEVQVRRMLADPRSNEFVSNFAGQWLYLRNLAQITPDPRVFPDFDDQLRQAFRQETELLFANVLRQNRSVIELLDADYSFLNERLAKHYGVSDVYGSHFRKVTLTDQNRRGLLGHGSILTVTAYATRTSPVLRGKWILENILGAAPPPPPPNVPGLPERQQSDGKLLTMRERMAQHRDNPACSSCHRIMDPPGFALEYFDAVGRWRTVDEGFVPIDGAGTLPNGAKFEGVSGLRQALLAEPGLFVTTVTEKMLTYALGRGVDYYDVPAVRRIVRESAGANYSLSALILGIVKSTPFQMRGSPES